MKRFRNIMLYCPDEANDVQVLDWCQVIAERAEPDSINVLRVFEQFLPEFPVEMTEEDFKNSEYEKLKQETEKVFSEQKTEINILFGDPLKNILNELALGQYDLLLVPVNDQKSRSFAERLARKSPVGVLILPPNIKPHFCNILMATDFSSLGALTLDWATAFSSLSKRPPNLKALHVMRMPTTYRATLAIRAEDLKKVIYDTALENLNKFISEKADNAEQWIPIVAEHYIAGLQIVQEAENHNADLIVMGAHGRNALSIALLGGTATEVIRASQRPILIVKRKNESLGFLRELLGLDHDDKHQRR